MVIRWLGQVQVVQGERADGLPAGGEDSGQGDDQPLPRVGDGLLNGPDLVQRALGDPVRQVVDLGLVPELYEYGRGARFGDRAPRCS